MMTRHECEAACLWVREDGALPKKYLPQVGARAVRIMLDHPMTTTC